MIDNCVESKPSNVECSVELKPSKVEVSVDVKPNIVKASVDVKPSIVGSVAVKSSLVDSDVSKLRDKEVETVSFFSTEDTLKGRDVMINWIRRQATKAGVTLIIYKSNFKKPMLLLTYEKSGEYKVPRIK